MISILTFTNLSSKPSIFDDNDRDNSDLKKSRIEKLQNSINIVQKETESL